MINLTACGRLAFDADLRATKGGSEVLSFKLPVETKVKDKESTVWLRCNVFGSRARGLSQHLTKGQMVTVCGRYERQMYDGKVQDEVFVSELHIHFPPKAFHQERSEHEAGHPPGNDQIPF